MEQVSRKARCLFGPSITLYMKLERPFSIDIGNKTKAERSDKRRAAKHACIKEIVEQDVEPRLPDGFWWQHQGTTINAMSGYRETIQNFTIRIDLPVTEEAEEVALLLLLSGEAHNEPLRP